MGCPAQRVAFLLEPLERQVLARAGLKQELLQPAGLYNATTSFVVWAVSVRGAV